MATSHFMKPQPSSGHSAMRVPSGPLSRNGCGVPGTFTSSNQPTRNEPSTT